MDQIAKLIEEEVQRRVAFGWTARLEIISKLYDIPVEQLIRDTSQCQDKFCKGVLKCGRCCTKNPQSNGYCGFHQNQAPLLNVVGVETSNTNFVWNSTSAPSRLNI
jgi:hypothetical protein